MEKRIYQIALSLLNGIGPIKAKSLLAHAGSLEGVFKESDQSLGKIDGIGTSVIRSLNRKECLLRAEKEVRFIERNQLGFHYFEDESYPVRLRQCDDSPIVLYTRGNFDLARKNIAVVGTRKASSYGKYLVRKFIEDLKDQPVNIISGLAYGIDIEAHRAALENNLPTLAVLGHGFDLIYPAAHKQTAKAMLSNGGLITEFASKSSTDTGNFPKRNRVVAGLCEATVVVESALSGGSLITANLANDYNRDVFAFPGNVDQEYSKGCNDLIQRNRAQLITSASDFLRIMNWETKEKPTIHQTALFPELSEEEEKLVTILREKSELDIDTLAFTSQFSLSALSMHLFNLELKGLIRAIPGKRYSLFQ